ncbi:MAG: helix-turn-helix domain-containing protein [Mycobacteriales bacterium]
MRTLPDLDAALWRTATFEGRPVRQALRDHDIGTVFRFLRTRGWSRAVLAAATGLAETRVRAICQGKQQVSSYEVLERIAAGLQIERGLLGLAYLDSPAIHPEPAGRLVLRHAPAARAEAMVGNPVAERGDATPVADDQGHTVREQLPALRRALDAHDVPEDEPTRSVEDLHRAVADVVRLRLESNYQRLASILPVLLPELHRALHLHIGQRRAVVGRLLAQSYRAADAIADKFGYHDLSARIIGLMATAALDSGDELTIAAASYVRAETFFVSEDFDTGRRMLTVAADRLMPGSSPAAAAAYGALHMRAAVLAARDSRPAAAYDHLAEAEHIAEQVPEAVYTGTVFGPASVRIHQLTLAVDLGDPDRALQVGDQWSPPASLPAERRSHFYIDLARAYAAAGKIEPTLASLHTAREIAPEHTREHPDVHHLLDTVLQGSTRRDPRLQEFAAWARASPPGR